MLNLVRKADEKIGIVAAIPAYNEEKTIAKVVLLAQRYVDRVIVCDDGSTDLTAEIAERLGAEVVRHERRTGYGAAIMSLFRRARELDANAMVTLDGDGQHDPDQISRIVQPIVNGAADVVIGSRFNEGDETPGYRKVGIKMITSLTDRITGLGLKDAQCGFRAYGRKALNSIRLAEQGMGASTEILLKAEQNGLRVGEVPIRIGYDADSSTHNPLSHGLDVVLSTVKHYSMRHPLLFYGIPGFLSLLVALGFWVWTLRIFAATRQVVTNIALVALGATMVGLMLLTTAVILWVLVSVLRERV